MLGAVVSYRSVPRILQLLQQYTPFSFGWVPHFTSVINWTLKLGLSQLKQVVPISKPWLAIIDHSIDIGTKKVLVVLRVTMDKLQQKQKAIGLKDCECIGLKVCETVNGETLSVDLEPIFKQAGSPYGIIKDGDATLNKGVRLWSEKQEKTIYCIDDIGHSMATALKHQFKKAKGYKRLTKLSTKGASRLRQTEFAFLIPPKLRTKGRFQNISKLGRWADKMIEVLAVTGRAKKGSLLERLRGAFPKFNRLKPFIRRFALTTSLVNKVMKILKNKGLNEKTYKDCSELAESLPKRSKVKKELTDWLDRHLEIQQKMPSTPLLVSSDIIESLFGHFKHIIERSPQADMNRTTLLIPALCGEINNSNCLNALSSVSQKDLKRWEEDNIPYTIRKKRQAFFKQYDKPYVGKITNGEYA